VVTTGILAGSAHTLTEESNAMEMLQSHANDAAMQMCDCAARRYILRIKTSHSVAYYTVRVRHNGEFGSAQSKIVFSPAM